MGDDLVKRLLANDLEECDEAADRIEELEAKLAKAVEASPRWILAMGDWEQGGEQAIEEMTDTLAELTGQKDE